MAKFKFWASGTIGGEPHRIEFEFSGDVLKRCVADGVAMSAETAEKLFRLDKVHGPGYVPRGMPFSRLNALNFLRWDAFDREPEIGGDPGEFEPEPVQKGVVY